MSNKWKLFALVVLFLVLAAAIQERFVRSAQVMQTVQTHASVLVIDAGHGGEDGGAVSLTGERESQINLAVACRLDQLMGLYGCAAVMTRDSDVSLHSDDAKTLHEKKVSDLHNRKDIIQSIPGAILISIHQNTYTAPQYHGAQVFYAPTEGSELFAETMQQMLKTALDPDNNRQPKQIADTIYLMNHITCCAILVECGFLTNPQEEQLLLKEEYQTHLAAALAGGYLQFLNASA